ncbi:DNA-binding response regulator [Bacteroidia bacterium]|nr:DNA-binding response regulator [Bacteroidia bacterium]
MNSTIRLLLVDDHALFRTGLMRLLSTDPRMEVVGEATNGAEFLDMLPGVRPDVTLLDIDMPVMDGIEAATRALTDDPGLKIITLSMHGEREYYFRMVSVGVKGFLLKNSTFDQVVSAITTVEAGGNYFSPELLLELAPGAASAGEPDSEDRGATLSQREMEILLLICRGESNQQIADSLFISKRTVDNHRANILDKTGCKNTASLVVYAIKHSLIEL